MPLYWCANFDGDEVLEHGLEEGAWLIQYQYAHGSFEYQGNRRQKHKTTDTWTALRDVAIGDWLIAYLRGSQFFAIGEVCEPKQRDRQNASAAHTDSVQRCIREGRTCILDGVVLYDDAPAFYEDFADDWRLRLDPSRAGQPATGSYSQRIDVVEWQHVVTDGTVLAGLAKAAPLPRYRKPLFQVDAEFFSTVAEKLQESADADGS